MTNITGWTTFREIVDDIMLAWGDSSDPGQFMRYLNFAIQGYEELRLRHMPATQSAEVTIDGEMRTVALPDDFLKFVSIGVYSDGDFYPFLPMQDMQVSTTGGCGVTERDIEDQTGVTRFVCYYALDLEHRRIIIDGPVAMTTCMLNYTPTGVRMDGQTYIPRMARAVIHAWVEFQIALRDKTMNQGDKSRFEFEYIKALNLFRGLQYDPEEMIQQYYHYIAEGLQY